MAAFIICGCATSPNQSSIRFDSNPTGAQISISGRQFGQAPTTVTYTFNQKNGEAVFPITATWASGAQATVQIKFVGGAEGGFTIQRPANAPGLDADIQIAMQLQARRDQAYAEAMESVQGAARATGQALGQSMRRR